jgi:hypothetical protein
MWGFESAKDVLDVLLVPAVGGAVALLWPQLQAWDKRRRFERLIARELEELGPHPKIRGSAFQAWTEHQNKNFVHKRIFEDASTNRDFILTLDATLVYEVSQLWDAVKTADETQWLWYLKCLADRYHKVAKVHAEWVQLIESYKK